MPDLITHVTAAHLIRRGFQQIKKNTPSPAFISPFYLGTILPDIVTRPVYIIFPALHDTVVTLHTPLATLLLCLLMSQFFERSLRKTVFSQLVVGALIHFFLDAFQKQTIGNNFWLFPFTWKSIGWPLFEPGDIIPFLPLGLIIVITLEYYIYKKNNKKTCHGH